LSLTGFAFAAGLVAFLVAAFFAFAAGAFLVVFAVVLPFHVGVRFAGR
jgi:hypothetical protein